MRAALELLDEVGLDGLSMRALADRLGVRAASLYWHLRDKDQLLDLLAEAILGEVPEPDPFGTWRASLAGFAEEYRRVLLSHRDAARIVAGLQAGPAALDLYESLLARLTGAGLAPGDAADATAVLLATYVPAVVAGETADGPPAVAPGDEFGAPLGSVTSARLVMSGGVSYVTMRGDRALPDLYRAHYEGKTPHLHVDQGTVTIAAQGHGRRRGGEVVLSAAVPWDLDLSGGVVRLSADLTSLRLRTLTVSGGATQLTLRLPAPAGTVPIALSGGVSRVLVQRPAGAPVRVRVANGASRLVLDDLSFGSVGGETRWQSADFASSEDRYEIEVRGGASRLAIGVAGDGDVPPPPRPGPAPAGLEGLSLERHPVLASVAGRLADPDRGARFRFGLDLLLDGLERRLGG